jgi:predicted MPP superfamily phosphohydrolase
MRGQTGRETTDTKVNHKEIAIDTGRAKPYLLHVTHQEMPLRGLPPALHGATLVHLSDFHAGFGNTDAVFHRAIDEVDALKPDLILLTGDYIDDAVKGDYPIEAILSRLHARIGIYGSIGNHDYRRGVVGTRRKLEKAGIRVLKNEGDCVAPGLWIAGVDDDEYGRPDLEAAMRGAPREATAVVLSHNPRVIERSSHHDLVMLSGHTHGGQICPPFPSAKMICLVHLRCRQVAGWYRYGRARLYVNRGIGVTGRPFRYRCPAELAVFKLVPETH